MTEDIAMERFQRIVWNKRYQEEYRKLIALEQERRFCKHDMEHFLAVARLCYIFVLEQQRNVSKDIIYGTAFLHDLGRVAQYESGIPHNEAGANLAEVILGQCGYNDAERRLMTDTIRSHREFGQRENEFAALFYKADKLSRDCIYCKARAECYWPDEKKNDNYIG